MANPQQGDVYQWPAVSKSHPMGDEPHMWVVVSRTIFNRDSDYVLACPLTSYPATQIDVEVRATPHNPLRHTSALLAKMITPIKKSELGSCRGHLPSSVVSEVLDRIRMIIEV